MIRGSISAKLNILIVMSILIVAGLLMLISNSAYRKAVFRPLEQKLNSLEVVEDTFVPVSGHFLKVFQTDEFQEAKSRSKSGERKDSMGVWMISQPPFLPESDSLYTETSL